jgi:hypothetical protein
LPQQNHGGSPARAFSASRPSNGMPMHQNPRSDVGGDSPQAVYGGAAPSLGVNPSRLASPGASMPNNDQASLANGLFIDGRTGRLDSAVSSPKDRPIYRQLAYKPGDDRWGPPPEPAKPGILSWVGRKIDDAERDAKADLLKKNPQIKSTFHGTIKAIVGDSFSREIFDNISIGEGAAFQDGVLMKGGVVYLDDQQWRAVHHLIGTIPRDKLGQRVRNALVEAEKRGRIRRKDKNR